MPSIDDNGDLQCPINAKRTKSGYQYIASNLLEFKRLGCVPMNVNLNRLDEGYGIAETLSNWGWEETEHAWVPKWTTLSEAMQ